TMDRSNTFLLYRLLNLESSPKVHPLLSFAGMDRDIRDPWYTGNFEETFQDILKGCTELLAKLS
ncbi:MAG: low molecular weight phosphotyrosine protein phosphatase, partial [Spirochaetes bacterium]|nr:low molecular weight phosphotyrosine protein phosphatase [Candidatus Gallitreponema excrementavium]